ncbi:MAG TPA: maleylpyruvate isomerase N-terminal domain-containing protein [Thermomicrobiaceae bacterium]|nr:maleylpyruvate isomerase N-terminal domain-containing protein [Thermomicrobiaceae bacterium]
MDRTEFTRATEESHREVLTRVDALDDAQLERPGASGWSPHDLLAHLAVWYDTATERLAFIGSGRVSEMPQINRDEVDAINEQALARDRSLAPDEVRQRYRTSYDAMLAALNGLPEATWSDATTRDAIERRVGTPAFRHAASHLADL